VNSGAAGEIATVASDTERPRRLGGKGKESRHDEVDAAIASEVLGGKPPAALKDLARRAYS
jgi:hypothetical protein